MLLVLPILLFSVMVYRRFYVPLTLTVCDNHLHIESCGGNLSTMWTISNSTRMGEWVNQMRINIWVVLYSWNTSGFLYSHKNHYDKHYLVLTFIYLVLTFLCVHPFLVVSVCYFMIYDYSLIWCRCVLYLLRTFVQFIFGGTCPLMYEVIRYIFHVFVRLHYYHNFQWPYQ